MKAGRRGFPEGQAVNSQCLGRVACWAQQESRAPSLWAVKGSFSSSRELTPSHRKASP